MLEFNPYVLLAQLINFAILYGIFKYFIADKLNAKITLRREQLKKLELAEAHYEEKMKLAESQREELLQKARKTTKQLMEESESIAKQKAQDIILKANSDAMSILEWGRREIEKDRLSMLAKMKEHIIDVSLKLNKKMFGNENASKEFLEKELKEIE